MIKITDDVRKVVEESGVEKGIVYVITEHTTTGITENESLPCVEKDLMECLDRIAPEDYPYHHNHYLPTYGTSFSIKSISLTPFQETALHFLHIFFQVFLPRNQDCPILFYF